MKALRTYLLSSTVLLGALALTEHAVAQDPAEGEPEAPPAAEAEAAPEAAPETPEPEAPAEEPVAAPQEPVEVPEKDTTDVVPTPHPSEPIPAPPAMGQKPPPTVFPPPEEVAEESTVTRGLETTVGMLPTKPDLGSEADLVSTANLYHPPAYTKKWQYSLSGYFRAPMRIGIGPRNDRAEGLEMHSPPRMVGASQFEWDNIAIAPSPTASLYINVSNARVSGNVVLFTNTLWDAGYRNLVAIGGISQAYVTLKFPEVFGNAGGLAWNVGAFSNRYGNAGPHELSSGYYQTYLFGRTHVAGESLTADVDLAPGLRMVLEHGVGAKIEVVPNESEQPRAPFLPDPGPVPKGSNFVHHAHAAFMISDWVKLAGHWMTSWSPNDSVHRPDTGERAPEARMNVMGGEVHVDGPLLGHGYLGYSRVDAKDVLPLADGIEILHSFDGVDLTRNYFDPRVTSFEAPEDVIDDGTIDTVLFQYIRRFAPLFGASPAGPDVVLALFGMYNHISTLQIEQDRLKFGGELMVSPIPQISLGARFDRVLPDGPDTSAAYSALSPRLIVHTKYLSREYVILSYTRYFLGEEAYPSFPYDDLAIADEHLINLSAIASF